VTVSDPGAPLFWLSLVTAGLAGSLHCVGMCGPILIGFAGAFRQAASGPGRDRGGRALWLDFAGYHLGRIWTYALLGLLAGFAGAGVRHGSALLGWQRPASLTLGLLVVAVGLLLLGVLPGVRPDFLLGGCMTERIRRLPLIGSLIGGAGFTARLLLGAMMGLLPCGLVYAMLVLVAGLPTPLHAATAMVVFGIGTLPALSGVLLAGRLLPRHVRAHGTRLTAALLIVAGVWMTARAWHGPHAHGRSHPATVDAGDPAGSGGARR